MIIWVDVFVIFFFFIADLVAKLGRKKSSWTVSCLLGAGRARLSLYTQPPFSLCLTV